MGMPSSWPPFIRDLAIDALADSILLKLQLRLLAASIFPSA
jgi:hypothetical protein